jgi:enamine deaminase RidA (YjgF/YER057c/UK114 family)
MANECSLPPDQRPTLHVTQTGADRAFLLMSVPPGAGLTGAAADGYAQIGDALRAGKLEIVQERVFGSLSVEAAVRSARREALQSRGIPWDGPLTYVQGRPAWGEGLAGVIIHALPASPISGHTWAILDGGVPCGRAWRTADATFVTLQNIQGPAQGLEGDNTPPSQTRRMLEQAERILRAQGLDYRHVVRTWIYLSNILGWYGDFNRARNARYAELGLMPGPNDRQSVLPASTGIGADLPGGAACTLDLLAVAAADGGRVIRHMGNRRQQEAYRYGSAFSRGTAISGPRGTLIEVSGTAAIDENGKSLYPNDIRSQVRCTLAKVDSLLHQARASLKDICAATVFVKKPEHAEVVREVTADLGIENLPAVCVVADICREELLFEIDAEAEVLIEE